MAQAIGFIAEDESDIDVLKILAAKVHSKKIAVSHFVGKGCGKLSVKSAAWCKNLKTKGCMKVMLVHDLDRNDGAVLRQKLEAILKDVLQTKKAIVIPTEELEAWLLSDEAAIAKAMKLKKPLKAILHPEKTASPKEHIGKLVYAASDKKVNYVNTVHNRLIAQATNVDLIRRKCPSFSCFEDFFK